MASMCGQIEATTFKRLRSPVARPWQHLAAFPPVLFIMRTRAKTRFPHQSLFPALPWPEHQGPHPPPCISPLGCWSESKYEQVGCLRSIHYTWSYSWDQTGAAGNSPPHLTGRPTPPQRDNHIHCPVTETSFRNEKKILTLDFYLNPIASYFGVNLIT